MRVFLVAILLVAILLTADSPAAAAKKAFIVAVAEYESKDFPPLPYAISSTDELKRLLEKTGYDKITKLNSPTKLEITQYFDRFLATINPNDDVFVAFSGHGWGSKQDDYFCPKNAEINVDASKRLRPHRNILLVRSEIIDKVKSRGARRIVLIDACRGAGDDRRTLPEENPGPTITRPPLDIATGTLAVFSCQPGKVGYWFEAENATLFMRAAIRGLQGAADNPKKQASIKRISLDEWVDYLGKETNRLALKHLSRKQSPAYQMEVPNPGRWFLNDHPTLRVISAITASTFSNSESNQTDFKQVEFNGAKFGDVVKDVNFFKCRFVNCDLSDVKFVDCSFVAAVFSESNLSGADFRECYGTRRASIYKEDEEITSGAIWGDGGTPRLIER